MIRATAAAGVTAALGQSGRSADAPTAEIEQARTISWQPDLYHGWPTLARRAGGELLVVCSGRRELHVCPFGTVELFRSTDNGDTWTFPRTVIDSPIDDRDAGLLATARGTLLVTTFTSLAYEPALKAAEKQRNWDPQRLARWQGAHTRISEDQRQQQLGVWMTRSTDGGVTWSQRYRCVVNSPHGPIQLSDGRLLYAGKRLWTDDGKIGVCESTDDGQSWTWLAPIPTRPGDDHRQYHELHAVEAADGTLIAQIRNHNPANAGETLQAESTDGGKSWSTPHSIGVWGLPSFLSRLRDGRLLMSYGHRRPPFGCQARVSSDHGRSWSEPVVVYGQGAGGDLGYPSTVELDDGRLVTVWYEKLNDSPRAALRMARWRLSG